VSTGARGLLALVAGMVLLEAALFGALAPLLPHYVAELGLSKSQAGVLSASYAGGALIGTLPGVWLALRIGDRAAAVAGIAVVGAMGVVFAFADSLVVLDVARFVQGVGGAIAWIAALGWLLTLTPRLERGGVIGTVLAASIVGMLLGPVLGALASLTGPQPVFIGVAVAGGGLALWALTIPGTERAEPERLERAHWRRLREARAPAAFWLAAVASLFAGAILVFTPLRLDDLGASGAAVGAAFVVAALMQAVVSRLAGRAADRAGRQTPIRWGLALSAAGALVLPLPATAVLVAIVLVAATAAQGALWTASTALLSDVVESAGLRQALTFAVANVAWGGGQLLGGLAAGHFADVGYAALPFVGLAVAFALSLRLPLGGARSPAAGGS
jgi:MFS family permease